MLDYQIEIINSKLPYLLDNLIVNATFIAYMRQTKLLTEESIEEIEEQVCDRKKVLRFTNRLKKQAQQKFDVFKEILKKTDQIHIFKEINHAEIKSLPKSPDIESNTREKLLSDLIPFRQMSTSDREKLTKLFVLREDYEEMNEGKHIQMDENIKLQDELQDAKKSMAKLKSERVQWINEHKKQATELKQQIEVLQTKAKVQETQLKEYLAQNNEYTREIKLLKQKLAEAESNENRRKTKRNRMEIIDVYHTDSTVPLFDMHPEEDDEHLQTIAKAKQCLQNLNNTANGTSFETQEKFQKFKTELTELQGCVDEVLQTLSGDLSTEHHCSPQSNKAEDVSIPDCLHAKSEGSPEGLSDTKKQSSNAKADITKHVHFEGKSNHISHKPKQPKINSHTTRQRNRVVAIETELTVLKNRLKQMEEERESQDLLLKQKDKKLYEEQMQIVQLHKKLREQKEHTDKHKLLQPIQQTHQQQTHQTAHTNIQTISFDSSSINSSRHTFRNLRRKTLASMSLDLNANCLNTTGDKLPNLSKQSMVTSSSTTPEYANRNKIPFTSRN